MNGNLKKILFSCFLASSLVGVDIGNSGCATANRLRKPEKQYVRIEEEKHEKTNVKNYKDYFVYGIVFGSLVGGLAGYLIRKKYEERRRLREFSMEIERRKNQYK